jgi:hypothetical protein
MGGRDPGVETSFLAFELDESKDERHVTFKDDINKMNGRQWIEVVNRKKKKERKRKSTHSLLQI